MLLLCICIVFKNSLLVVFGGNFRVLLGKSLPLSGASVSLLARRGDPLEIWPPVLSHPRFLSTCPLCTALLGGSRISFIKLSFQTVEPWSLYLTLWESCFCPCVTENVFLQGLFWFTSQQSSLPLPTRAWGVSDTRRVLRLRGEGGSRTAACGWGVGRCLFWLASPWHHLHTTKFADFRSIIHWTVTSVLPCNHHHNHDIKHFCHHKKSPPALYQLTHGCSNFFCRFHSVFYIGDHVIYE